MLEGWSEYFFMIGSSAAALIGLMFVVVTLTAGRGRQEMDRGKHLYTSPVVWHLGVVLVLSGAAIAPGMTPKLFGAAGLALGLFGVGLGAWIAAGIVREPVVVGTAGFDMFWYGVAPGAVYAALLAGSFACINALSWGIDVSAAALMALLLVSIHAEWDLVTFLAPIAGTGDKS